MTYKKFKLAPNQHGDVPKCNLRPKYAYAQQGIAKSGASMLYSTFVHLKNICTLTRAEVHLKPRLRQYPKRVCLEQPMKIG